MRRSQHGANRHHVEQLLEQLAPDQLEAVERLLEVMLDPSPRTITDVTVEDETIGEEEKQSVVRSKDWFLHNEGIPFKQVVTELGFTMEQILKHPELG